MSKEYFSLDAERMMLSCMIMDDPCFVYGIETLKVDDFYYSESIYIYGTLKEMYLDSMSTGLEKLIIKMKTNGTLDIIGGVSGLMTFFCNILYYRKCDAMDYAKIIRDFAITRDAFKAYENFKAEADSGMIGPELLEFGRDELHKIDSCDNGEIGQTLKDYFETEGQTTFDERIRRFRSGEPAVQLGIQTGLRDLDKMIGGIRGGNLVILAARTSMGKTSLALNIATNLAASGKSVIFFSLEMSKSELAEKIYSFSSGTPARKILEGSTPDDATKIIYDYVKGVVGNNLIINDLGGLKTSEIISRCLRAKEKFSISAIFIDYLQLVQSDENFAIKHLELSEITRKLKSLAKRLDIPVICLAQLARRTDERSGHRPELSDMRESGSIEQDADLVLGLLRRDYYDKFDRPGEATIIVMKNRMGPTCDVTVLFDGETTAFKDKPVETFDVQRKIS